MFKFGRPVMTNFRHEAIQDTDVIMIRDINTVTVLNASEVADWDILFFLDEEHPIYTELSGDFNNMPNDIPMMLLNTDIAIDETQLAEKMLKYAQVLNIEAPEQTVRDAAKSITTKMAAIRDIEKSTACDCGEDHSDIVELKKLYGDFTNWVKANMQMLTNDEIVRATKLVKLLNAMIDNNVVEDIIGMHKNHALSHMYEDTCKIVLREMLFGLDVYVENFGNAKEALKETNGVGIVKFKDSIMALVSNIIDVVDGNVIVNNPMFLMFDQALKNPKHYG